jgi:rhomboid-like protein
MRAINKDMFRRIWVVRTIIVLNIIVFFLWHLGANDDETSFMVRNFLVSFQGLREGRVWTLLTSEFSHNMFWHIFINMYVLQGFGSFMEHVLGSFRFLKFYLAAAIMASLTHALVSAFLMGSPELPALGASGAISGVILLFALMFPSQKILLFFFIPVPAIWGALGLVGLDLWGMIAQTHGSGLPIGFGAHLGGAFTGLVYYFWLRLRRPPAALAPQT